MVGRAKQAREQRLKNYVRVIDIEAAQGLSRNSGSTSWAIRKLGITPVLLPGPGGRVSYVTKEEAERMIEYFNR